MKLIKKKAARRRSTNLKASPRRDK